MPLIEKRPTGLLRLALRAPLLLYRARLGRLLGGRFLLLVHEGRSTGLARRTLLEVAHRDLRTGEVVVLAAWGESAAWYRNLSAMPAIEVRIGRERWPAPNQRFLDEHELDTVLQHYQRAHPRAARAIATILGWHSDALRAATSVIASLMSCAAWMQERAAADSEPALSARKDATTPSPTWRPTSPPVAITDWSAARAMRLPSAK